MATDLTEYQVLFPPWYDERWEAEAPAKGFLPGVQVAVGGRRYSFYFIDPSRLQQTLEDDQAAGRPYYAEPGLVVVPEVSTEAIRQAVAGLVRDGFFHRLAPSASAADGVS
jgi:hypothetical protein